MVLIGIPFPVVWFHLNPCRAPPERQLKNRWGLEEEMKGSAKQWIHWGILYFSGELQGWTVFCTSAFFFFQNQTSAEHLSWSAVFFEFAKWPELCEILSISHDTVYLDQAINLEQSRLLTHLNNIWIFLIATCLAYSWSFVVGVYEKLFSKEKSTKSNGLAGTGC